MFRIVVLACCVWTLSGCAGAGQDAWWRPFAHPPAPFGQYHFDWQLSGDPDVAPLQVFDDGRNTWLQYPQDAPVPAVFERSAHGDRLLRPVRDHDYLVVSGVPDQLVLRGGHQSAQVQRASTHPQRVEPAVTPEGAAPDPDPSAQAPTVPLDIPIMPAVAPATPAAPARSAPASSALIPSALIASAPEPVAAVPAPVHTAHYGVTPQDGTVRQALKRWARQGGWVFEDQHWAVDVDIPLAGSAQFQPPFKQAVRELLAATELGDRPLQPCFYANQVLRVVPVTQRCDRTAAAGEPS